MNSNPMHTHPRAHGQGQDGTGAQGLLWQVLWSLPGAVGEPRGEWMPRMGEQTLPEDKTGLGVDV